MESHATFSANALSFLATLGKRLTGISGDLARCHVYSKDSRSLSNSVLIHESFVSADEEPDL